MKNKTSLTISNYGSMTEKEYIAALYGNGCPICHAYRNTSDTAPSWVCGDILRGKKIPCLSCHQNYEDLYRYAMKLIADRSFFERELLFWRRPSSKSTAVERLKNSDGA